MVEHIASRRRKIEPIDTKLLSVRTNEPIGVEDIFVRSITTTLQKAVFERNVSLDDVYNHFSKSCGSERIVDVDAVLEGAERLGISPSKRGATKLMKLLNKGATSGLTRSDMHKLVYEDFRPCEIKLVTPNKLTNISESLMTTVYENLKVVRRLKYDKSPRARCTSWHDDGSRKATQINIPVENILLIKKVEETTQGQLFLIGTMIQTIMRSKYASFLFLISHLMSF